jgi:hypothetical protein
MNELRWREYWEAKKRQFRGAAAVCLAMICVLYGYFIGGGADGAEAAWPCGIILAVSVLGLVFLVLRPIEEGRRTLFCLLGLAGFVVAAMLSSVLLDPSTDMAVRMGVVATASILSIFGGFAVAALVTGRRR